MSASSARRKGSRCRRHGWTIALSDCLSLLKLDVEGHELAVLHGARGHLLAKRPRIAAWAYHFPGHLIDFLRFVAELNMGYRLAIRLHSNMRHDTVLYAF